MTCPGTADKRLYLTGSVHLGRPSQFVFPPSMEAALGHPQQWTWRGDISRCLRQVLPGRVSQEG
ncbi:MAG TPA: hypothetical protein VFZ09_08450 [Archangium sp.]|uniref:hypothetical protein n=1 Tax=Archangium sp. TaxID=1872627 RepID=UPI002E31BF78|nr:hypothetical protein [Archangium sp.]HEX5746261.1 hypothetical protein [Archangium sp.]